MEAAYYLPSQQLAPYIRYYFTYAMDEANVRQVFPRGMHILPTSSGKMGIFLSTPTIKRMAGQADTPNPQIGFSGFYNRPVFYHTSAAASMIIVTFTPIGLQQLLNFSLSEIRNHNLHVREASAEDYDLLCNEIYAHEGWGGKINVLDTFFLRKFRRVEFPKRMAATVDYIIKSGGAKTIKSLCSELGIGERTLQRNFLRKLGITPKAFSKLVRFQKAIQLLSHYPGCSLTDISYGLGYFDQAHFIHEFCSLYGDSPGVFRQRNQMEAGMAMEAEKSSRGLPFPIL